MCLQVLAEVHPYLDIEDRALLYLESLLYRLLSKICAIGPLQKQDVKSEFPFLTSLEIYAFRDHFINLIPFHPVSFVDVWNLVE